VDTRRVRGAQTGAEIVRVLDLVEQEQKGRTLDALQQRIQILLGAGRGDPHPGQCTLMIGALGDPLQLVALDLTDLDPGLTREIRELGQAAVAAAAIQPQLPNPVAAELERCPRTMDAADRVQPLGERAILVARRSTAPCPAHDQTAGAVPAGLRLRRLRDRGFLAPSAAAGLVWADASEQTISGPTISGQTSPEPARRPLTDQTFLP
jgi:hypothetical protein